MKFRKLLVATMGMRAGCTGMTPGENAPGDGTYLDAGAPEKGPEGPVHRTGAIAVDDRDDTAFVLQVSAYREATEETLLGRRLYAVNPDGGRAREVGRIGGTSSVQVVFPRSGVLVLHGEEKTDTLSLFARGSLEPLASETRVVRYDAARMAPSRRWLAVRDRAGDGSPTHVIDGDTLETSVIPPDGGWLESVWMNGRDELLAIVFYDAFGDHPSARILSWRIDDVAKRGLGSDDAWSRPRLNIELPAVNPDLFFESNWIGVSPDDSQAVFPVVVGVGHDEFRRDLLVLDTSTGQVRRVQDAWGPAGFTPDGKTIVSHTDADDRKPELLLIDADTLVKRAETVPVSGGLSYFVSHEGNLVVAASSDGDQSLVLYDVDNERQTKMDGAALGLQEFVQRAGHGELWLVDDEALFRLDLLKGQVENIPIPFRPRHVNILPGLDLLVLDDADGDSLWHFDPDGRTTKRAVTFSTARITRPAWAQGANWTSAE